MNYRFRAALLTMVFYCIGHAQNAQDSLQTTFLDEVIVADSRFPLQRPQSGKTVIKLGPAELARYSGGSIADVLNRQAGLEVSGSRSRPGAVLGIYAQGGRDRQAVILIDGVRLSDPASYSRAFDLRLLSTDQVQSIEILKGANSSLYGSNAATVVINITTNKNTTDQLAVQAGGYAGTLNSLASSGVSIGKITSYGGVSGAIDKWNYALSAAQEYADGLSDLAGTAGEKDPNALWSADFTLGKDWKSGLNTRAFMAISNLRTAYDDVGSNIDAPYEFHSFHWRTGLRMAQQRKRTSWEWTTSFSRFDSEDQGAYPFSYAGDRMQSEFLYRWYFGTNLKLLSGLGYDKDITLGKYFDILDPYVHLILNASSGWNLNAGGRLNVHSDYGTAGVYSVNPSRVWHSDRGYFKILGSIASAYITPTLNQLYGNFGANPDLEPESNVGVEVGVEGYVQPKTLQTSLLYFKRVEKNLVVYNDVQGGYFNADTEIRAQGLEFEFRGFLLPKLYFNAHYTYTHRSGDSGIRIPKHKGGMLLDTQINTRNNLILDFQYTGARNDLDFRTFSAVTLRQFSLLDLRWNCTLSPEKLKFYIAVSNILNTEFQEVYGYSTPGRNV
ncbi:MAG: hypothetical protein RLZZ241_2486, partial [Bacteroidota bacterium]